MSECKTWTLYDEASGVKIVVTATQVGEDVSFNIKLVEGIADLNGFFIDFGGDGGDVFRVDGKGNQAINMNGSDADGNPIGGFDAAYLLGKAGLGDGEVNETTVVVKNTSLADLGDAIVGIRATSVGEDREGSLKLTAPCDKPPPNDDDFPLWGQDISNVVLVFDTESGDDKPKPDGDGYYTVKIDSWPDAADDDLDKSIEDILAWLIENDPNVDADTELLGAIIKGGQQDTNFYAYGDNNTNGTAPDDLPAGLALSFEGSENPQPANAVDNSYDYDAIFG